MDLDKINALTANDMSAVNQLIAKRLQSDVALINQVALYIINSGGKRLRPALVLLGSGACGYQGTHHHTLAAIVEFIHTATLLHDDVVDASELRRGKETANAVWGNEASVLVGDFLYSRAFQMMVEIKNMRVMDILAEATNTIAAGEVMQLLNCHDADTTEERYLHVIHSKTAKLFAAAAQLGAIISHKPQEEENALATYGMHLGTAFQLIDDALDYNASPEETGKNIGDDLAEGKPTLPLIRVMQTGTASQKQTVRHAIEKGGLEHIEAVKEAILTTDALQYTTDCAKNEAQLAIKALAIIPDTPYKEAMIELTHFSINRRY
ncbi:Octaprenyl diphosphate synthase [hydrothermal vent metagenome]|uniref:Octaprenyl diphosphate synthase n=1 Tax=hydrothermal vent metagenome TaxID=652676 RepID=A0A3B0ZEI6_9ZZZZ